MGLPSWERFLQCHQIESEILSKHCLTFCLTFCLVMSKNSTNRVTIAIECPVASWLRDAIKEVLKAGVWVEIKPHEEIYWTDLTTFTLRQAECPNFYIINHSIIWIIKCFIVIYAKRFYLHTLINTNFGPFDQTIWLFSVFSREKLCYLPSFRPSKIFLSYLPKIFEWVWKTSSLLIIYKNPDRIQLFPLDWEIMRSR